MKPSRRRQHKQASCPRNAPIASMWRYDGPGVLPLYRLRLAQPRLQLLLQLPRCRQAGKRQARTMSGAAPHGSQPCATSSLHRWQVQVQDALTLVGVPCAGVCGGSDAWHVLRGGSRLGRLLVTTHPNTVVLQHWDQPRGCRLDHGNTAMPVAGPEGRGGRRQAGATRVRRGSRAHTPAAPGSNVALPGCLLTSLALAPLARDTACRLLGPAVHIQLDTTPNLPTHQAMLFA